MAKSIQPAMQSGMGSCSQANAWLPPDLENSYCIADNEGSFCKYRAAGMNRGRTVVGRKKVAKTLALLPCHVLEINGIQIGPDDHFVKAARASSFQGVAHEVSEMKELQLKVKTLTPAIAQELEGLELITFLHHPPAVERLNLKEGFIKADNFPATIHGFHSVTIAHTEILLSSHPPGEDEIVFLWEYETKAKPLYFVFAKQKRVKYTEALKRSELSSDDFLAILFPMNHPRWSNFIVWNGTVHCELTDTLDAEAMAPSFYVLEPLELTVQYTRENDYGLHLSLSG